MKMNIKILVGLVLVFIQYSHVMSQDRPNVLLINIDDMGWLDVGFMGSKYYQTPNLDELAKQGMIFTQAYAGAANCAPSRACLMSGQWGPRHGIYTVDKSDRGKSKNRKIIPIKNNVTLPDETITIAEAFQQNNYKTCHAGKWHLGEDPKSQGFDVNIAGSHAGNPGTYYPPFHKKIKFEDRDGRILTDQIMDLAIDFLNDTKDQSFFLYYSPYTVHTPIQAIDRLLPKYQNKPAWNRQKNPKYATMIENLDLNIGKLIQALKQNSQYENTLIIFTSDNGGVYRITGNKPLRAGKGSYYEGGIREPFFAVWPGKIKANSSCDTPIYNLDIYPTLLEAAQIQQKPDQILDGKSIYGLFLGKTSKALENRALFWHFPIYLENRVKNPDLVNPKFRTTPGAVIRKGDWKLHQYFEDNTIELYNLKDDVAEKNNLAEQEPKTAQKLLKALKKWQKDTNAPIPKELNPAYEKASE